MEREILSDFRIWSVLALQSAVRGTLELLPWFAALSFVGNGLGSKELAALSLAEAWGYWWLIVGWNGVYATASTLVSQSHGASQHRSARGWLVISIMLIMVLNAFSAVAWALTVPVLISLGFDADMVHLGSSFLLNAIPVLIPFGIIVPISAYLTAVQAAWLPPVLEACSCAFDIGLSYVFILGIGTIRGMGLPGAAYGWIIASSISAALYIFALCWAWGREHRFGNRPPAGGDGDETRVPNDGSGDEDAESAAPLLVDAEAAPALSVRPGSTKDGDDGDGDGGGGGLRHALSFALSARCWRICLAQAGTPSPSPLSV
jgi:hypothetical protein